MLKSYSHLDNTTTRWYVMIHKNPQKLDLMLKRENATYRSIPGDMRQIEYFIPFCFLSRVHETGDATVVKAASFANQLREDFHDFAFFHTTERGIAELLDKPWNAGLRYRLRHFRDLHRNAVTISDAEMNTLLRVFSERKLKYTIGLPVADPSPDMIVSITANGPFNGQTARVIAVKHMPDGISLTLGVTLFQGVREIKLPDFRLSDIHLERNVEDIIGWTFIQTVEATLLDILSRRINHKETDDSRQQDSDTLNRLFLYSYINISNPAVSAYFLALMLICSHLRFDKPSTTALAEKAKAILNSDAEEKTVHRSPLARPEGALSQSEATERTAYREPLVALGPQPSDIIHHTSSLGPQASATLCFALYIATRDANYRTQGKQLVQHLREQSIFNSQFSIFNSQLPRLASLASKLRSKRSRR